MRNTTAVVENPLFSVSTSSRKNFLVISFRTTKWRKKVKAAYRLAEYFPLKGQGSLYRSNFCFSTIFFLSLSHKLRRQLQSFEASKPTKWRSSATSVPKTKRRCFALPTKQPSATAATTTSTTPTNSPENTTASLSFTLLPPPTSPSATSAR